MLRGVGVSGDFVTGTIVKLNAEQLADKAKYLEEGMKNIILTVPDLTVADLMELAPYNIVGIVAETGNYNTHVAIQIRKMEITAALSVPGCMDFVASGDDALLDGINGDLVISPRKSTLEYYRVLKKKRDAEKNKINAMVDEETRTRDGLRIGLQGNVDDLQDIEKLAGVKGDGIGLFRTEKIFFGKSSFPKEEEQYEIYMEAARIMEGKPITIRTLDAGGIMNLQNDKEFKEENPFLGCRGIRYSLMHPGTFRSQCKAILRASAHGRFRILLPMLSTLSELRRAYTAINLVKEELDHENIPFDRNLPIGVMIETPAAAWMADSFAREADFISIGTNDLTQYMLAADRGNKLVKNLYSHYDPSVLRALRYIVKCCMKEGTPVNVSGEAASDERLIPLLLLYGIEDLSVNATALLNVRKKICDLDLSELKNLAATVDHADTVDEVLNGIDAFGAMYLN